MKRTPYPALTVEGGLLPAGLFDRIADDDKLPGRKPSDYGLMRHESIREVASSAFDDLTSAWTSYTKERERLAQQGKPTGALTRQWAQRVLKRLEFGVLQQTPPGGITIDGQDYPVTHLWEHVPIHLLDYGTSLDKRTKGVQGAAKQAPQSMLQELLNRTDEHLWAIVCNGQSLRVLRDSRALAGSAYAEFDLELIFSDKLFSDFMLMFRLLHATRFQIAEDQTPAQCWLERWRSAGIEQGERVREKLEKGVREAIETLGTGFLQHPANAGLTQRLAGGQLSKEDYLRALLRLAYRLVFWFVTEDRGVLLDPDAPTVATKRYAQYFSSRRLRERAVKPLGTGQHADLWEAVKIVFTGLGGEQGRPELALPGIGGLYERITRDADGTLLDLTQPDELDAPLENLRLSNENLLKAVRALAVFDADGKRRQVDFEHLDSEELGSVYERLLELHPRHDPVQRTFTLEAAAGNERKTTGSYYTPSSLVEALLDSALDPVLADAVAGAADDDSRVEALLNVTVCDPACGSGHFLVAAARRIARRIAQIRSQEDEPSPAIVRSAMREVVSRCIHGVDLNEMAAELAKVSLWLESVEPGKPLAFLDANIRVGNSLLGATPALVDGGVPAEAFKPIEGDDKKVATALRKQNEAEFDNPNQGGLFDVSDYHMGNEAIAGETAKLIAQLPASLADLYVQRRRLASIDAERVAAKRKADAWCAAFVQDKTAEHRDAGITNAALDWISGGATDLTQQAIADRVDALTRDYRFFHWHVEFPHIFTVPDTGSDVDTRTGWRGGFTAVIGNPPWDRVKLQEQEFFAARSEKVANAPNANARKKEIAKLAASEQPAEQALHAEFLAAKRHAEGTSHLLRDSGSFPLTGRGDVNTYQVFAETFRTLVGPHGQSGVIVPTGIATDATTQHFFKDLVKTESLSVLYDFENGSPNGHFFHNVHRSFKFSLLVTTGMQRKAKAASFAFFLHDATEIESKSFAMTPEEIMLLNPNTGTCPVFRSRRDAEITLGIYKRVPVLVKEGDPDGNPWGVSFMRMFDMSNDSHLFHTRDQLESEGWTLDGNIFTRPTPDGPAGSTDRMLPLYEAKMIHHYDHRWATYDGTTVRDVTLEEKQDPTFAALPRYWVKESEVDKRLAGKWDKSWLIGWRDICRSTDERTMIASFEGYRASPEGGTLLAHIPQHFDLAPSLVSQWNTFAFDFVARQKVGGTHLKYFTMRQLPTLPPKAFRCEVSWASPSLRDWIKLRVLELAYTGVDMAPFAADLGDEAPPFRWDPERRALLRAELDAAFFHLYGVDRDDADYIMDTFPIVRRRDEAEHGEYRTKRLILDVYDKMAAAIATGEPYQTILDPPPGHGPRHPTP